MMRFEVLVEGASDVPTMREILTRRFGLEENTHFRIHPHKGRGNLPADLLAPPSPQHQALLDQLPAKLRGFSYLRDDACVIVVVDVDDTPPQQLMKELDTMLERLPKRPKRVLFGLAIEEMESWFIADHKAVLQAYPRAKIPKIRPDDIVGAWEKLAEALNLKRNDISGADKCKWAQAIAPYLDLDNPYSPSLKKLIEDISTQLEQGSV